MAGDALHRQPARPPPTKLPDDPAPPSPGLGHRPGRGRRRSSPRLRLPGPHSPRRALPAGAVEAYAYARTGYHRGLDALRRAGWKGARPVPWAHEPNRGFLRRCTPLARAAEAIEETDEAQRCAAFLRETARPRPGNSRADRWWHRLPLCTRPLRPSTGRVGHVTSLCKSPCRFLRQRLRHVRDRLWSRFRGMKR